MRRVEPGPRTDGGAQRRPGAAAQLSVLLPQGGDVERAKMRPGRGAETFEDLAEVISVALSAEKGVLDVSGLAACPRRKVCAGLI